MECVFKRLLVWATVATFSLGLNHEVDAQNLTYQVPGQSYPAPVYSPHTHATSYSTNSVGVSLDSTSLGSASRIRNILEQARQQLNKDNLPKLAIAKNELESALSQLQSFVGENTANGKLWNTFLRVSEIKQQLEAKTPSYVKILDLEMNMRQNYLGLEYSQFTRLREALHKYALAARFNKQEEGFVKFLGDALEKAIEDSQKSNQLNGDLYTQLVTIATNLHQSQQASPQLQQLRAMFSSQNVRVTVNESLVSRLAARPVSKPQGVDECILGTRVLGTAYMNGNVSLSLLPMNNGIGVQLDLSACLSSQSRGYNRGVVLNTTSSSPVLASKQVYISDSGVSSAPATVSTQLSSTIQSIEHRSRLVRRIAKKKAAQQKPEADAIAEGRMQTRIQTEFNEQVDQQVSQSQPRLAALRQKQIPEIRRVGFKQPPLDLSSTSSEILGGTTIADTHQLAAPGSCPLSRPANASVVGEIHESALCNAAGTLMAGRTIRNSSLGDLVKQITGKIPDDLKDEIEGEEWSITFNPAQPIRIEFDDNLISLTVRLVRMTRGKQTLEEALSISAKYLPQLVGQRLILTRQGEVTVTSDKQTRGTGPTALRAFLKNKFDKTFRTSIVTEPISLAKLQSRIPPQTNLVLDINRVSFQIDQGWLQVALPL